MGNFAVETEVRAGEGYYEAEIHETLATPMGPFGGYVAALALRAAGAHTSKPRPISINCHFVNVAEFGKVEAEVKTLRSSSRLDSIRVDVIQNGKLIIEALVWAGESMTGLDHELDGPPEVPSHASLKSFPELFRDYIDTPFSRSVEGRPILNGWSPQGEPPWSMMEMPAAEPRTQGWVRLHPIGSFGDPWVDAGRMLIPIDWLTIGAASFPNRDKAMIQMPSLDMSASFYNLSYATEWVFCAADSPIARDGIATGRATIWAENGELLSTGMQQVLQRVYPLALGGPLSTQTQQ